MTLFLTIHYHLINFHHGFCSYYSTNLINFHQYIFSYYSSLLNLIGFYNISSYYTCRGQFHRLITERCDFYFVVLLLKKETF